MRYFPNAARRRLGVALTLGSLAAGVIAVPLAHADDDTSGKLENQQKTVEKQIERTQEHLEFSSKRVVKAAGRLDAAKTDLGTARSDLSTARSSLVEARARLGTARTQLVGAQAVDQQMQAELEDARVELQAAQAELVGGRIVKAQQSDRVASMVADVYMNGDSTLLSYAALLEAKTPEDLARQGEAQEVIAGEQTDAYEDLRVAEANLEVQRNREKDAKERVAEKAEAAAQHLAVMADLEQQAEQAKNDATSAKDAAHRAKDDVAALVVERHRARRAAQRAKDADKAKLARLKREDARIERALAEAARQARLRAQRKGQSTAPQNSGGFLNRPVPGTVTSPFGYRTHPIYGYWGLHDGTDFSVGCGDPLYADADGVVLQSYWSSVYGNRLVVDNGFQRGVGLASIYNHATSYTVGVGTHVKRGDLIGYAGSTGWSTGCHLHFTVMANGKPVDPMAWF